MLGNLASSKSCHLRRKIYLHCSYRHTMPQNLLSISTKKYFFYSIKNHNTSIHQLISSMGFFLWCFSMLPLYWRSKGNTSYFLKPFLCFLSWTRGGHKQFQWTNGSLSSTTSISWKKHQSLEYLWRFIICYPSYERNTPSAFIHIGPIIGGNKEAYCRVHSYLILTCVHESQSTSGPALKI
jgi:hypothetical protein